MVRAIALCLFTFGAASIAFAEDTNGGKCNGFTVKADAGANVPEGLLAAMCQYYEAQERRDWKETYNLRPRDFRELVPYDTYVRDMSKRSPHLAYLKLEIHSVKNTRPHEIMTAVDFYRGPGGKPFDPRTGSSYTRGITEWILEADAWKCASCGEELLYTLNTRMVFPDD